ncbi:hypothetical protein MRB53_035899 [Persea americana]|uniref:Uncharacterized protein n=1 Tax=Persea americana TaxID=3435 RepID=A0ACC2K5Z0_PERAE|nr:hypothetical protein MRB53_035899 [Persea americana]
MTNPRRLKGHKGAVTCCIASRARPGILVSSGEDGRICWFDLRCKDVFFTMDLGKSQVSSICFKAGDEDVLYASIGSEIVCFDVHLASSWKPLESYNYNSEEINQIAFSSKSPFLAAADDSGDVKIIDTRQKCLYKTLRAVHTSICSSVQFLPWRPWEVVTGGLDAKLVMWDFSRGRPYKVVDFGMPDMDNHESSCNAGQCFNPAFVHAIAVPEMDMLGGLDKFCAVAKGDGAIDVINITSELAVVNSTSSSQSRKGSKSRSKGNMPALDATTIDQGQGKRLHLDYALGGHTAAVSCVAFSLFGQRGKFIISGGNDAFVKVWDWSKYLDPGQTSCSSDLPTSINVNKKVNWLCTTPADSENIVVCDTSKLTHH